MVWSLALCPDNAKQDLVVYGAEFGVVFLAKVPRTASIQEGPDDLGLYHSGQSTTMILSITEFPDAVEERATRCSGSGKCLLLRTIL